MIYGVEPAAIIIFVGFVLLVLGISFYLGRRAQTASSYFAAEGKIHWSVNGVAFAGDYLSAASFLGIAGMIATAGYDGFLYSIGFLAGWVVALFVVAEPMKRLGKYTFSDALDSAFQSRQIRLAAAISTLVVSICYLIPQMVGAGALVTPLLGLPHYAGVIIVGSIVILIVSTAGMTSTTYVQFIKGGLLIIFSLVLVVFVLVRGFNERPTEDYPEFDSIPVEVSAGEVTSISDAGYRVVDQVTTGDNTFVLMEHGGLQNWWHLRPDSDRDDSGHGTVEEALSIVKSDDAVLYNGAPKETGEFYSVGHFDRIVVDGQEVESTGPLGPAAFLSTVEQSDIVLFPKASFEYDGAEVSVWYREVTAGSRVMRPGLKFQVDEGATVASKLNFVSLMLALFLGTSALPHILIRYYTVSSARAARRSTILAITLIGFFYILTLFMGLGAMGSGIMDVESSNMAAPLLARLFGVSLFAFISAIAFATVLGTVSGLIVAASGAIAHDIIDNVLQKSTSDVAKVTAGKISAAVVGGIAILLGISLKGMNVGFLVGLAFAVAASANLPSILMVLFWKRTTSQGIVASITVGIVSSLGLILLSPSFFERYGLDPARAIFPLDNPGIISIPLSFAVLIVVSLLTRGVANGAAVTQE